MTNKDLKDNEVYYDKWRTGMGIYEGIYKIKSLTDKDKYGNFKISSIIYITEKGFYTNRRIAATNLENLRLATEEEKQWLNKCIELNKYIPKEEAVDTIIDDTTYTLKQIEAALSKYDKEDVKDILDAIKKHK